MPITFSSLAPFDPLARITLIVIPLSSTITFVQRSPPPPNLISSVHTPISHLSIFQPPFHSYLWKPSGNRNFNRERGFFTKVFPPRFLLSRVSGRRDRENIDKENIGSEEGIFMAEKERREGGRIDFAALVFDRLQPWSDTGKGWMFNEANGGRSKRSGTADSRGFDTLKAGARKESVTGLVLARDDEGVPPWTDKGGRERRERRVGSQSRGGRGCTMGWIDCIMYGTGLSC